MSKQHLASYGAPHTHGGAGGRPALRIASAAMLLWGGMVLILFGAGFHKKTVLIPEEKKAPPVQLPEAFLPAPPSPPGAEFTQGVETEPQLIREVTVGGVTLSDAGEIKRTYAGKPPSLCPT